MGNDAIPRTYEAWRHCITEECGIALTQEFVARRLAVWRDSDTEETKRFRRLYGDDYLGQVIGWFQRADRELR